MNMITAGLHKQERRSLFRDAMAGAEELRDIRFHAREKGERPKKDTLSATAAAERQTGVIRFMFRRHVSLPVVVKELLRPEVEEQITSERTIIEVGPRDVGILPAIDGAALSIMATGLDRFVRGDWDGREFWAGPDSKAWEPSHRLFVTNIRLEQQTEYKHWLENRASS